MGPVLTIVLEKRVSLMCHVLSVYLISPIGPHLD